MPGRHLEAVVARRCTSSGTTSLAYWKERSHEPGGRVIVWVADSPGAISAEALSSAPGSTSSGSPSTTQFRRFAITGRGQVMATPGALEEPLELRALLQRKIAAGARLLGQHPDERGRAGALPEHVGVGAVHLLPVRRGAALVVGVGGDGVVEQVHVARVDRVEVDRQARVLALAARRTCPRRSWPGCAPRRRAGSSRSSGRWSGPAPACRRSRRGRPRARRSGRWGRSPRRAAPGSSSRRPGR